MAEPENHTLRLLREIRDSVATTDRKVDAWGSSTDALVAKTEGLAAKTEALADVIDAVDGKIDRVHADLKDRLDHVARALAGEIVQSRYASVGMEEKIAEIERRLTALEQAR